MSALMKKTSFLKQVDEETQIQYCYFCKKKAEFRCGVCLQAVYCTSEHQKADWPSHKVNCVRPEDKLKQLYKQLMLYKKNFFDKLSKKLNVQSQSACENILKTSKDIVQKFPTPQHEIQYGSAVCSFIKIELVVKNFENAQQVLNNYLKQKNDFLCDISLIPEKISIQNPKYKKTIWFVEGKLKLLSVLSNLMHQIVRNSVYVIQILLKHCQKFYGSNSLELSNMYFELANYYCFLNQLNKACACYLIAGKMRNQKGVTSYFNAAIILMRNHNFQKAAEFFYKCLQMIYRYGDSKNIIDRVYLALAYCNKKMNHFNDTTEYLEKALCQLNLKNRFQSEEQKHIREILKMLSDQYKKQITGDQLSNLPRERIEGEPQVIITNSNYNDLWELDNSYTLKKRDEEWKKSFKNQANKTKFQTKIPATNPLVEKVLFVNHFTDDKNQEVNALLSKSNAPTQYIHIDLSFMTKLTAMEVRFMAQLNRLLAQNKQKSAVYDIVENSNLMQEMSKEKIQRFYQLNPELIRQKQEYNLMGEQQEEVANNGEPQQGGLKPSEKPVPQAKQSKPHKGFKLDLNKLTKVENP